MAATGYEVDTVLALPHIRSYGTLVTEAYRLDTVAEGADRVGLGIVTNNPNCDGIQTGASDCDQQAVYPGSPSGGLTVWRQPAFSLWASLECSALSGVQDLLRAIIGWRIDALGSAAIASELITGAASGGDGLTDAGAAPSGSAGAGIGMAVARIESGLAARMGNGVGMVHMAVEYLGRAANDGAVILTGDGLRTRAGHVVVADGGYPTGTIWGSGPVGVSASSLNWLNGPMRHMAPAGASNRNIMKQLAAQYVVIAFNPCLTVKTTVS
jgi:hypothetical protein